MSTILYILVGIVVLIAILGMIAPKNYNISRTIVIKKSVTEVYSYLKFIKNQDHWSPWAEKDPNMKKTFTGTDGEVGCVSAWEGNKDVGSGEQELKGLLENEEINTELRFLKPWKSTSDGYFKISEVAGETEVKWGFKGYNKFPTSIMMLFMNMDKAVGGDFEQGLAKLKKVLED